MQARFSLRFEAGVREGEREVLASDVTSLGRRPDNTITVSHASVSGRHAELKIEGGRVFLVDSNSTNGSRVNGEKIERRELAHGDRVTLGSVQLVFEDAEMAGAPTEDDGPVLEEAEDDVVLEGAASGAAALPVGPGAGATLSRVSTDRLAASGSRSKVGLIALVMLVGGAGGAAFWFQQQSGAGGPVEATVADVAGNVLEDYSFEDPEAVTWASAEAAPQSFFIDSIFAFSGNSGLGVVLAADEWAFARSESFRVPEGKSLELVSSLEAREGAIGRVGVEISQSTASRGFTAPTVIAWAPSVSGTNGFADIALSFDTLPGYDTGSVVVAGKTSGGEGDLSLDDVSVVIDRPAGGALARFEEYELHVLGNPGSTAVVSRSGSVLFSSLSLSNWSADGLEGDSASSWTGRATDTGFEFTTSSAAAGATCEIWSCGGRALAPNDSSAPWLSTIGPDGYRAHATAFERERATDLLTGGGINLVRFGLERPVAMSSTMHAESAHFRFGFEGSTTLQLQLQFRDERDQANQLAHRARSAEKTGELGTAIATWSDLLDRFPFDANLIAEAEGTRARLTEVGNDRVDGVRREIERARFFELDDLYRNCRARATEVATSFAGSEIESAANALVHDVDTALGALASGSAGGAVERLSAVLDALDQAENPELFAHVKKAIEAHAGR